MPGVWIGGLPWWASQQEVLNWCWTFGSNPEGIQLIRRRDDTLISCIAHYGSEAGQQAALRALGHSFYGFRVSVRAQRVPAAQAVPAGLRVPRASPQWYQQQLWCLLGEPSQRSSWRLVLVLLATRPSWRLVLLATRQCWRLLATRQSFGSGFAGNKAELEGSGSAGYKAELEGSGSAGKSPRPAQICLLPTRCFLAF